MSSSKKKPATPPRDPPRMDPEKRRCAEAGLDGVPLREGLSYEVKDGILYIHNAAGVLQAFGQPELLWELFEDQSKD